MRIEFWVSWNMYSIADLKCCGIAFILVQTVKLITQISFKDILTELLCTMWPKFVSKMTTFLVNLQAVELINYSWVKNFHPTHHKFVSPGGNCMFELLKINVSENLFFYC